MARKWVGIFLPERSKPTVPHSVYMV